MKTHSLFLLIAPFIACVSAAQDHRSAGPSLQVVPAPQQVVVMPVAFKVSPRTRIVLGERTYAEDKFAAEQINERIVELRKDPLSIVKEETLKKLSPGLIYIGSPAGSFGKQWLKKRKISFSPELKQEGYILEADQGGVVILGETARGRYYGVMTLLQILDLQKKSLVVPGSHIRDWPVQKVRGITDDISRGQISNTENFKAIIRFLSRHKLNVYSPYIEDVVAFRRHPLIGKGRGEISTAELRELDAYAKKRHVELIPIFETLGHWENILVLPEYAKYGEFPGAHTVNVSDEAVYTLLDEMIGELSSAFSSPFFNMAADESWDVGLGVNKDRVAASDLATVHAEHYKRLFDLIRKHGKKPMMYGDILLNNPAILDKIPKDVIIVDWHYGAAERYSSPEIFKTAGFPFVVSPAVWNFSGPFPNYVNSMINIRNLNRDGYVNGSLGLLTSNWNDYGGEALREFNYYGYAWTAECAWRPLDADLDRFNETFFRQFFGSEEAGLFGRSAYAVLSDPFNQINWHELWRHPLLPARQSTLPMLIRLQSLRSGMPLVRHLAERIRENALNNAHHGRAINFVARLNEWFAWKNEVAGEVRRALEDSTGGARVDSLQVHYASEVRAVLAELRRLKEEFRSLWLETNRLSGLNLLMMRYDRQIEYWEETLRTFERTGRVNSPLIRSQWIYHPLANPGKRDSSVVQVPKAYFRRAFSVAQPVSNAKIQLIGDTHARLWVNGMEIGEVYARRSLSLFVEHHRAKMWDIGPLLKSGENIIAVEAANYARFGSAGINVYGELKSAEGSVILLSDTTWSVAASVSDGWRTAQVPGDGWGAAAPKAYPFEIIAPNFDNGRLSWIER